jgi:hypothetical protein
VKPTDTTQLTCPSSQAMEGAVVFAVVGGTVDHPSAQYLSTPLPASEQLLGLTQPVEPTEVFRLAGPCAEGRCRHFERDQCSLATRLVQLLPPVVERLPPCTIRATCRWWAQEGKEACRRCPQIVTQMYQPSEQYRQAASS